MKILEIPSFFTPYGGEFCLEQSKALTLLNHEVSILINVQLSIRKGLKDFFLTPYSRRHETLEGLWVLRSDMRGIPLMIKPNVNRWVRIVREMFSQYLKEKGKPDIIHAHCAKWAGYAAYLISKEYNIPYVITEHLSAKIHEVEYGPAPSTSWQIPLIKKAYHASSMVIPVSRELVDDLDCYFGHDYKFTPISNAIDTSFFHYKKREPLSKRCFNFCCLAQFTPLKGYDVLFKAFRILCNNHDNVRLHIAGRGTQSKQCLKLIKSNDLDSVVINHDELNKQGVRDLLFSSDCLVLASRSEAQPLVLLEAMSTGIPTISTKCTPKSLRIEDGCFIVPINDENSLASAMERVINNNSFDGKTISEKVSKLASRENVAKQIEVVFKDILNI